LVLYLQRQAATNLEVRLDTARSKLHHHGFEDQLNQMADGIERKPPATATLVLLGENWTQPALLQYLRSTQGLMAAVRDAQRQVRVARHVLAEGAALLKSNPTPSPASSSAS
jgi:hypothetical protein